MRDSVKRDPTNQNLKPLAIQCPMCKGSDFEAGKIHPSDQQFVSDNAPLSRLARWWSVGQKIQAFRCKNCSFVALYAPKGNA